MYYFNAASGVSQWEPPLWLDEIDPATGAVYYVNSERYFQFLRDQHILHEVPLWEVFAVCDHMVLVL